MKRFVFIALLVALVALPVVAQVPTGTLSGHVTDGKDALPGVTVSASSPNLQGTRIAVTSGNGDYIFPFLPPGEYTIKFELQGFQTVEATVKMSAAQTSKVDAVMQSQLTEEIVVTGSYETISTTNTASTTYEQNLIEQLPVPRDLYNAVALAPGVHTTGPSNAITISGAQSFENLFLINGVVVNENLRGQATNLFIEDAIQETTTSVSGISSEYGRFAGGVVNMLTKSGGNDFHGSFRTNFDSDKWTAESPLTVAKRDDTINKTYEATLGGFFWKDHIWFFGAGRDRSTSGSDQTIITAIPFSKSTKETRYEGKLTISPTPNHRLVGSYIERTRDWTGYYFPSLPIVDTGDSIYPRSIPEKLYAGNYTGVLSENFFVEGQYSKRQLTFLHSGSRHHDDPLNGGYQGTVVYDNTNGYVGNAAIFCGVCEPETRDNKDYLAKGSWFLSTPSLGSHDIVFGVDKFEDLHMSVNHQSGSDWTFSATEFGFSGQTWWPVVYGDGSADIDWQPILQISKGSNFTTKSAFINDKWRLNDKLSFNIGLRYDKNHGVNATGAVVSKDSRVSPRVGVSFDPKGDGEWVFNASYANYVTALVNSGNVGDKAPTSPSTFIWLYGGPDINTGAGPYLTPQQVLAQVFTWFKNDYCDEGGHCGINNFDLLAGISLPGQNRLVKGSLHSPYAEEIAAGGSKRIGNRGLVRVDYTHREFKDLYEEQVNMSTGKVNLTALGVNWGLVDLGYIQNSDYATRKYDGVALQGNYRVLDRLSLGGNYTWSHSYGNFDGETSGSGPITQANNPNYYPEYRDVKWSNPRGNLGIDQRHRGRVWAVWDALTSKHNRLSVSLMESYASGSPYSAIGANRSRLYVTNPGYSSRPTTVTYYFSKRGAYLTDNITSTDISLNYSFMFKGFGSELEIFVQPEVQNLFNEKGVIGVNTTIRDRTNSASFADFNPWTTAPKECPQSNTLAQCQAMGANWQKGPSFGKPTTPSTATVLGGYQAPRTYRISVGFRF